MGQDATEMVVRTSVLGTFRMFFVMSAGFLASKLPKHEPLLKRETCRTVSRVCALLFLPALMLSSTGSTLTPATLGDAWQLVISASLTISVSFCVAWAFGRLLVGRDRRRYLRPVQLAIAFPNSASFPLLLMDSLCAQDIINRDFENADECFTKATGMIFIYVVVWQMWFYAWGFYALGHDRSFEFKLSGEADVASDKTAVVGRSNVDTFAIDVQKSTISTRSQAETTTFEPRGSSDRDSFGGEHAAQLSSPRREEKEGTEVDPDGGHRSVEDGGASLFPGRRPSTEHTDCLSKTGAEGRLTIASSARRLAVDEMRQDKPGRDTGTFGRRCKEVLLSPNIVTVVVGIIISLIPALQDMLFNNPQAVLWPLGAAIQTVGTPTVAVSTVVMASSLVQVPSIAARKANKERSWRRHKYLMCALHVTCRLIVVPAAGFAAFWLADTRSSIMGSDRLMHLILLIEFAMPSAAMIIVSLNQLRMPATAGFMARLYLVQYGLSMFTISAWTAVALRMLY